MTAALRRQWVNNRSRRQSGISISLKKWLLGSVCGRCWAPSLLNLRTRERMLDLKALFGYPMSCRHRAPLFNPGGTSTAVISHVLEATAQH